MILSKLVPKYLYPNFSTNNSNVGEKIETELKLLKQDLKELQRQRIEAVLAKMEPLIIRDPPSQKTNYKMQVCYDYKSYIFI